MGAPVDGKLSVVVIVQSHRAERRDAGGMLFQRVPLLVFGYRGMRMRMMMKSGHAEGSWMRAGHACTGGSVEAASQVRGVG